MTDPADCLFCKIVVGGVPADVVHRSGGVLAFRDINPQAPLHVLVIPVVHVEDAGVVTGEHGEVLAEMLAVARAVAESEGAYPSGYRLVFNVGEDALNSVPHLHLHVIGGRPMTWPPG